jgi:hypothetical protein
MDESADGHLACICISIIGKPGAVSHHSDGW